MITLPTKKLAIERASCLFQHSTASHFGKTFTIQKLIDKLGFESGHILTRNYVAVKDLHGIPIYFRPVWDIFEFA